jgi:hypothetical protein
MNDETADAFMEFPKMARLFRDCVITEKIDGTNAQILITDAGELRAGSRTRWITPEDDNFGFARWAQEHRDELLKLGPGRHFGEWWGGKIQRGYGVADKRWSLFNTVRWCQAGETPAVIPSGGPKAEPKYQDVLPACCGLVPVLYKGPFNTGIVREVIACLADDGSAAAPGFMDPEGVVVFHTAANCGFKVTIKNDGTPKSALTTQAGGNA